MKVAISSDGENLQSNVDQRFGRCPYFLIVDIKEKDIENFKSITNEGAVQGHGAGIRAGEQMGELKIDAIITGQLGPNATNILKQLKIKAYTASGEIKEVLENFVNDKLELITEIEEPHTGSSEIKYDSDERIFFPLLDDNELDSQISQHFGHAPFFGLYEVNTKKLTITENDLDHTNPNKSPIDQIEEAVNPTTIFAKGIGERAIGIIQQKGLRLKTGNYATVKEAIDNLDNLSDQAESCGHKD